MDARYVAMQGVCTCGASFRFRVPSDNPPDTVEHACVTCAAPGQPLKVVTITVADAQRLG